MEKKAYEKFKALKSKRDKGEKLTFAERNIINIIETKKRRKQK